MPKIISSKELIINNFEAQILDLAKLSVNQHQVQNLFV